MKNQQDILQKQWERYKAYFLTSPQVKDFSFDHKEVYLTTIVKLPEKIKAEISAKLFEIKSKFPEFYYHEPENLHLTVMYWSPGDFKKSYSPELVKQVIKAHSENVGQIKKFKIYLRGLNLSQGSVFVQAFYKNQALDNLREGLIVSMAKIDPDYDLISARSRQTGFGWVSFARYQNSKRIKDFVLEIEKFRTNEFGSFNVDQISLYFSDKIFSQPNIKLIQEFKLHG